MTRRLGLIGAALLAAGCTGTERQSALDPAGVQAGRISDLWWSYFYACLGVYCVVMAFVLAAFVLRRRPQPAPAEPETEPPADAERRRALWVWAGTAVTVVILFGMVLGDFMTGRALDALERDDALVIGVVGHQWWWEVRYPDPDPSQSFTTANEIHVPVGRTVRFELSSPDVIHSFWVPNLHGKTDMIPGHPARAWLRADRPGVFWGQCAEFCGHQHANMRFVLVAEPEEDFRKWQEAQRQPAPEPKTDGQRKGRQVFLGKTCATCHTIQGTPANGRVGPDLTHLASRPRLAAGTLPNTRGHLGGWVADPQGIKPGVRMPPNPLSPEELRALLDYLESLK